MKRRALLLTGSSLLFTGCSAFDNTRPSPQTEQGSTDQPPSPVDPVKTEVATVTETNTRLPNAETQYAFGEQMKRDWWKVAVTSLTLKTSVGIDDSKHTFKMPADQQLAIATVTVKNISEINRSWVTGHLAFIVNDRTIYQPQPNISDTDSTNKIPVPEFSPVDHRKQFTASGFPVKAGTTGTLWIVTPLSRDISVSDIQIGFDGNGDDSNVYPVRWSQE